MNQRITRIKEALEQPFEKTSRDFRLGWFSAPEWAAQFAREIVGGTGLAPSGKAYPPDQYTVTIHPDRSASIKPVTDTFQQQIGEIVEDVLRSFTYEIVTEPHITLATDPTLGESELRVIGWHSSNPLAVAEKMSASEEYDTQSPPVGAFLVVEGRQHFELKQPVVRIGRRLDNDLVLDDPHVSREHFRLVARNRRYLLEDLGSTSGTRVNGKKIREHFLQPGDVINVASIDLIYGEDTGGPPDVTPPYYPEEDPDVRDRVTPLDLDVEQIKRGLDKAKDGAD
ncbi:MAG: DUF3662 domain-containing protein [Anaerolineales bacterium]|nr:DUF3662 domain-containing protein [Anaerolineales bacterium]